MKTEISMMQSAHDRYHKIGKEFYCLSIFLVMRTARFKNIEIRDKRTVLVWTYVCERCFNDFHNRRIHYRAANRLRQKREGNIDTTVVKRLIEGSEYSGSSLEGILELCSFFDARPVIVVRMLFTVPLDNSLHFLG